MKLVVCHMSRPATAGIVLPAHQAKNHNPHTTHTHLHGAGHPCTNLIQVLLAYRAGVAVKACTARTRGDSQQAVRVSTQGDHPAKLGCSDVASSLVLPPYTGPVCCLPCCFGMSACTVVHLCKPPWLSQTSPFRALVPAVHWLVHT